MAVVVVARGCGEVAVTDVVLCFSVFVSFPFSAHFRFQRKGIQSSTLRGTLCFTGQKDEGHYDLFSPVVDIGYVIS